MDNEWDIKQNSFDIRRNFGKSIMDIINEKTEINSLLKQMDFFEKNDKQRKEYFNKKYPTLDEVDQIKLKKKFKHICCRERVKRNKVIKRLNELGVNYKWNPIIGWDRNLEKKMDV